MHHRASRRSICLLRPPVTGQQHRTYHLFSPRSQKLQLALVHDPAVGAASVARASPRSVLVHIYLGTKHQARGALRVGSTLFRLIHDDLSRHTRLMPPPPPPAESLPIPPHGSFSGQGQSVRDDVGALELLYSEATIGNRRSPRRSPFFFFIPPQRSPDHSSSSSSLFSFFSDA